MRVPIIIIAVALYSFYQTLYVKSLEINSFELAGKRYYIEREKKLNWYGAEQFCRTMGGHLATIETDKEAQGIYNHLKNNGYVNKNNHIWYSDEWFWIGCNDIYNEGHFSWIGTGKPVKYTNWADNQPDNAWGGEDCGVIWRHGEVMNWNDNNCTGKCRFVCEFKAKTVEFASHIDNR